MPNLSQEENSPTGLQPSISSRNIWQSLDPKKYMAAVKYAETGSYAAAAREVGSRPETVRKWGKDLRFSALVSHLLSQYEETSLVSRLLLERMALDVYAVAMGEEDTHGVDKDGVGYSAPTTNLPAANQAISTLHRINHDTESRKIDRDKQNSGQTVILNIEQANFNSNQHFEMLQQKSVSTSTPIDGAIEDASIINPAEGGAHGE